MRTLSVVDIGTNSIRLGVVRIDDNHNYHPLALNKEVIRLGEGEFGHNRLTKAAMERGLLVLKKFADIANAYNSSEIVVVATAAAREAQNRAEFVERAREEAGVEVKVISGIEEARLIYLGVSSGIDLNSHTALFVDIGGGTTELILGGSHDYSLLESLKLGAIRFSDMFHTHEQSPVSEKTYRKMVDYSLGVANHAVRKIADQGYDLLVGSSGTIMNLAEITARRLEGEISSIRNYYLKYEDLQETISILCKLDLRQRLNVPGINPDRADIIVSGAAILDAIMKGVKAPGIQISDRALRDGLVIDRLFQEDTVREAYLGTSVRERSIMQLGRACRFEENHGQKVAGLAGSIFDQLKQLGIHPYGKVERELLTYAALMHDIGTFISYGDHHKHSYYLVRNSNLLGFTDDEIEIVATAAMCHRKLTPQKLRPQRMSAASVRMADVLCSILRISDALDRSQLGLVSEVICRFVQGNKVLSIEVYATEDCPLEMWALENKKSFFERIFGVGIIIKRVVMGKPGG